ncbi:peptidase C14 [Phytoactinopolyspora halotolerans]|uniref:Peptidase C14 n=1 Tax=Phytoactinopolyspora halotolerans TaxID=1981512 RepID=A0A6L9S9M7_9ACTN|nr:peptidase C14 [Phytoactinopolyspora halotolerans]
MHAGVGDFRWFGVFGSDTDADDALDALVGDASIHRIEAHTELNFTRRHRFTRSDLELDFGGNLVTTEGIEDAPENDPFAAVMFFRGTVSDDVRENTLVETMPDLLDVWEVADASQYAVGEWYALEVDALTGRWEREVQRLVEITQIVDGTHVRVNYKNGWDLEPGRTLTWTRIDPVRNVHIRNMRFAGVADGDQVTGSHPIAYEYAVSCDVSAVHATGTFWPVVMRRWCTHFRTAQCSLANPASVTWGGAGYLTQQIYCLYGHVADCHTANARHLNDWTASAYGYVENCHGDGDDQGPFVTHGQYEHDLVYTGNSGLMTFANSGAAWGSAAKRISVRKHVCSWFVARVRITDLTLEDVQVIGKAGLSGSGMLWVNADGVQLRGCQADDTLIVSQSSSLSGRANIIDGCHFRLSGPSEVVRGDVEADLHIVRTTLRGLDGHRFNGTGTLRFTDSTLVGADEAAPIAVAGDVHISGGELRDTGVRVAGTGDADVRVGGGCTITGSNSAGAFFSRESAGGVLALDLSGVTSTAGDADMAHVDLDAGTNRYSCVSATFTDGRLRLAPDAFGDDSYLLHTQNVERGVDRVAMPDEGERVQHGANLVLPG